MQSKKDGLVELKRGAITLRDTDGLYRLKYIELFKTGAFSAPIFFFINVTSSQKSVLSSGMIKPQSRKRW